VFQVLSKIRIFPIVIDSGASVSVSPCEEDFYEGIKSANDFKLSGLADDICVKGMGRVRWRVIDQNNQTASIDTVAYFVANAGVRLFSPQAYFQENGEGSLILSQKEIILTLKSNICLSIPFQQGNNLPFLFTTDLVPDPLENIPNDLKAHLSVVDQTNQNITGAQRELLLWHWRLGHIGFQWLQALMRERHDLPAHILTKAADTRNCIPPLCVACQLAKQTQRNTSTSTSQKLVTASNAIRNSNDVFPGSRISVDQYQSAFPGRLPDTAGRERFSSKFNGGTIFVDHGSGYVDMQHQVSLNAGETIMAKRKFERIAALFGVSIQSYHGDNGVFKSAELQAELTLRQQTMSFSGTGAHHQNGIAERAIQQTTLWARAMLLHALIMWPNQTKIDL
jgi:hypothetical protein